MLPPIVMDEPLPPTPAISRSAGGQEALNATHRFLASLMERDLSALESQLDANVCSWWTRHGRLASVEGAKAVSLALVALVDRERPTRLDVRPATRATCVTSSLVDDELCWSLELNVEDGLIVGAYVRGADLE